MKRRKLLSVSACSLPKRKSDDGSGQAGVAPPTGSIKTVVLCTVPVGVNYFLDHTNNNSKTFTDDLDVFF